MVIALWRRLTRTGHPQGRALDASEARLKRLVDIMIGLVEFPAGIQEHPPHFTAGLDMAIKYPRLQKMERRGGRVLAAAEGEHEGL